MTTGAVAEGVICYSNTDGFCYGIDTDTGKILWKYQALNTANYPATPVVGGGKLYITAGMAGSIDRLTGEVNPIQEFACIDIHTGKLIWHLVKSFPTAGPSSGVGGNGIIAYGNLYMTSGFESGVLWAIGPSKPWSMFRHDAAQTELGQSGPTNLMLRWTYTTGGAVISSPAIVNGRVYVGSQDQYLYCLDAETGAFIWKFKTGAMLRSSPAVVNGKVYIGPDDGNVYCLDTVTGGLLWSQPAGGYIEWYTRSKPPLRSSPMVVEGKVYVGALDGNLYCLDANYGNVLWKYPTTGGITASPAVTGGAVYIVGYYEAPESTWPFGNATMYKLNAVTGALIRTYDIPLGSDVPTVRYYNQSYTTFGSAIIGRVTEWASPTVAAGMIFTPVNGFVYYAINETTGQIAWRYDVNYTSVFTTDSMTYNNGIVYFSERFNMDGVNATTGKLIWTTYLAREIYASSAISADGKLYLATTQRGVYVLDALTGAKLGWYEAGSEGWSSPAIYGGKMYVGNNDNNIYCFGDVLP
jgi:outer membrane protein assembly factor BamB